MRRPRTEPAREPRRVWEDEALDLSVRVDALLARAKDASRGEIKALGGWLDGAGAALAAPLRERLGEPELPGKKLLRVALDRQEVAVAPGNPTHRDEGFVCAACGAEVPPNERVPRDHCPRCLVSLHVDVLPGDRASTCRGLMEPVDVRVSGDEVVIGYRCRRCDARHNNRAARAGVLPDDWAVIVALSQRAGR